MLDCAAWTPPSAGRTFSPAIRAGMVRPVNRSSALTSGNRQELVTLLADVAVGDKRALRGLYERTSAKLYGICLRLLGDPGEAQDVLQEVYLTVWRKAGLFEPSRASPITWLAVITRNKALDHKRRARRSDESIEVALEIPDDGPLPTEILEDAQDGARLMHCLDELDDRPRSMIRAAFLDGATYSELAQREGVPLPTMKSWIRRGLLRLKGCMER